MDADTGTTGASGGERRYRVEHRTSYGYHATMSDGYSVTCLLPRATPWQDVVEAEVGLEPPASEVDGYDDAFGNRIIQFGLHEPHEEMVVSARSEVVVHERPMPVDPTPWEVAVEQTRSVDGVAAIEVGAFVGSSTFVDLGAVAPALRRIADTTFTPSRPVIEAVAALSEHIHQDFEFDPHFSTVSTPLDDVLIARRGVCQDFAHLAIGCLRSVGLAARYVSGYIETVPPPGQDRLVGADASHAWCSVWTPQAGWVDFDPTNGHLPVNDHVTVAWGRDYADVIPVRGVMIGPATEQLLDVAVDVVRV